MLKLVDNNSSELESFCERDSFGTKVAGYYKTFGSENTFALFWLQYADDRVTAALCKVYGSAVLCAAGDADFEELAEFLRMIDISVFSCDAAACDRLGITPHRQGNIVEYNGCDKPVCWDVLFPAYPDLAKIYDLLCRSGFDNLGDCGDWMADISMRMRKDAAQWCIIDNDGEPSACACALFITDKAAFLGCVATDMRLRCSRLGSSVVMGIANRYFDEGKRVNLFCRDEDVTEFYKKIGFSVIGRWAETEYIGSVR